jgi:DNA-binding CsgD family transcriptional regulator
MEERSVCGWHCGGMTGARLVRLCRAEVARWRAEADSDDWHVAVDACRAANDPHLLPYALVRQGEALLREEARDEASAALSQAAGIATRIGAQPVAEAATSLGRRGRLVVDVDLGGVADPEGSRAASGNGATGLEPGVPSGEELGLTEREVDVLRLVADGRSNSQVGAALYISPKTVSVHVSNILAKLGVSSHGEAAAVAHRSGLLGNQPI